MNENKFTPTAEEALRLAQEAAGELGHGYVGTEHLLLGLMREDEGMAHTVLTEAGLTDDLLTEMVRKSVGAGLPGGNPAQGLTPRAKHVVEIAMEDSIRGGYAYIGTEHLLAGILRALRAATTRTSVMDPLWGATRLVPSRRRAAMRMARE